MSGVSDRIDEALGVFGRLVLFAVFATAALFVSGVILKPLLPMGLPSGREGRGLFALLGAFSLVIAHVGTILVLDRGQWSLAGWFGREQWSPRWLVAGPIAAVVALLVGVLVLLGAGALTSVPSAEAVQGAYLLDALMLLVVFTAFEELAFRGYLFGILEERWGALAAIALTSVSYAIYHARDPSTTAITFSATVLVGTLAGVVRWRGGLPAAWLTQFVFAATQALALHFPSRGMDLGTPDEWRLLPSGPAWLSGGNWGVEGGVAVAGAVALVTFLLFRLPRSSGLPPRT